MRQRLLASAGELFVAQGYEATSLQQIVKAAGTSVGNCYFYYPNKEAILFAIGDQLRLEVASQIDSAIEGIDLGPQRFALAVYTSVIATLERDPLAKVTVIDTSFPSMRILTMDMFAARARRAFAAAPELFQGWPEATPDLAAAAWHGSVYYILEGLIAGRIQESPARAARFATRWNLQSLGLPASLISQALEALPQS
jgi:AcrR family transcriptional regulator